MRRTSKKFIALFVIAGFLFFTEKAFSDNEYENLFITEIMYDPEGSNSNHSDWIEVYNNNSGNIKIDKNDFGIIDEEKLELGSDGIHYKNCHRIKENIDMSGKDFIVIADNDSKFKNDYPDFEGEVIDSTFSFSGSGDYIRLSADRCETFFQEVIYEDSWGGKDNGKTLEKIEPEGSNEKNNWQESYLKGGTPGEKNSEKIKKDYSKEIRINEIFPNPEESPEKKYEYVELYNYSDKDIDLEEWKLKDENSSFDLFGSVMSGDFIIFYDSVSLNNSGDNIELIDPNGNSVSKLSCKKAEEKYSYSFDDKDWKWSSFSTPGEKNIFDEIIKYEHSVYLSEIFPNPSGEDEKREFVELYNPDAKKISLSGWTLKDSSKTGKYVFPEKTFIKERSYLVIYRDSFKFALNNSGKESVYLLDPNGDKVSSVSYNSAKENVSFNFNGRKWKWSKFKTPEKRINSTHFPL